MRRVLMILTAVSAVFLVPWTVYLSRSLPTHYDTEAWRWSWVGFDIGLLGCFAVAAVLGRRRHRAAATMLCATGTLMCADAWFDITLDWGTPDVLVSIATAVLVELPVAVLLFVKAHDLASGGMSVRTFAPGDVALRDDEECRRVADRLDNGPVGLDDLRRDPALTDVDVDSALRRMAAADRVRRGPTGRWSLRSVSLRQPGPHELAALSDRDRIAVQRHYDAKFEREVAMFAWAAERRDDFGAWAQGSRSVTALTEAELAEFAREYERLLYRYCQLHDRPTPQTRDVALRWYAFPPPAESDLADRRIRQAA